MLVAQSQADRVDPARVARERVPVTHTPEPSSSTVVTTSWAPTAPAATGALAVGAIRFAGLEELTPADFADIVERYVGRSLDKSELSRLAEEVAARVRGRGYIFASAAIEPQRLAAGVLTVRVDPGRIDEVRLAGVENSAVRDALTPLVGKPARMDQVERRLLIAGDIDGASIVRSAFVREGERGILLVTVAQAAVRARVTLDNDSTKPIGPYQIRADLDVNGIVAKDDTVTFTYSTTPLDFDELQYGRVSYGKRVSADGTEVSAAVSFAATRPGSYLEALDLKGRSWSGSLRVLQPLRRRRDGSLWASASIDLRDSEQRRGDVLRRDDRIVAVRLALTGSGMIAGGRLRGSGIVSQGLPLFGATDTGDRLASRADADGTFTSFVAWSDWTRGLSDGWSIRLAMQGQVALQPLLIAEEIGMGGGSFLRGYDYSERSGDQGILGSLELRYDWRDPFGLGRKAQLYAFLDGGSVGNLSGGFGGGSLASAGGGVRADVSSTMDANLELAFPLTEPRYETGGHDPRLVFRVLRLF